MSVTVYGIPNCDAVKKARKLLDAHGVVYTFYDFREQGLDDALAAQLLQHISPAILVNRRSTTWKQLSERERTEADDLARCASLLSRHPTLVKRPLIHSGSLWLVAPRDAELLAALAQ